MSDRAVNKLAQFNDWLADHLGNVLSSMYFFYFCLILDLVELPPVIAAHSTILWVTYLSQAVIQLVALPILGAQNKLQNKSNHSLHKKLDALHDKHDKLHDKVEALTKGKKKP